MKLLSGLLLFCAALGAQPQRIAVKVDPRIELMAVTQILADYGWTGLLSRQDTPYRRDVDAWFAPYKNHPAVKRFAELAKAGYTFDGPAGTMVCLTAPPELKLEGSPEQCGAPRAGGAESLARWLEQLRALAAESDFMTFFRAHAGFYAMLAEATGKNLPRDYAADLENYYGTKQGSYTIVLAPLLVGNFGPRLERPGGTFDIFGILGGGGGSGSMPQFGSVESLRGLVWHEFGHSFLNPEIDRLKEAVARSGKLLEPIAARMKQQAYGNWHTAVIEHIDRAVEVRLAYRELGEEAGESTLGRELANGFAYVEALAERLKEYEQQRDRYPAFRDFAPRLVAVLDELAGRELPREFFAVPLTINGAATGGKAVYVIPTGETDSGAQQKTADYVRSIQKRFASDAEVITDEQALARDLSGFRIVAYGTLSGNRWIAKHRDAVPGVADLEKMSGQGPLRLIAAMPNPRNPQLGAVVYTATEPGAVAGINSLFHGPTVWVIGKEGTVLATGTWRREKGRWVLK
jgi:hypothetical protein